MFFFHDTWNTMMILCAQFLACQMLRSRYNQGRWISKMTGEFISKLLRSEMPLSVREAIPQPVMCQCWLFPSKQTTRLLQISLALSIDKYKIVAYIYIQFSMYNFCVFDQLSFLLSPFRPKIQILVDLRA